MVLDKILNVKRAEIAKMSAIDPLTLMPSDRDLMKAVTQVPFGIIGEIKSQSPSEGVICEDFHPEAIAKSYEAAGVHTLSVLTDREFFGGSFDVLETARNACALPAMCKEFILDEKQIYQARKSGADAVLLIVRILSDEQLLKLKNLAESLNMTALIEVFDETDCERASKIDPQIIGINNRNLDTLKMDMENSRRLKSLFPNDVSVFSLSGVKNPADIQGLKMHFDGVLVGTALMRSDNPSEYCQA